MAKISKLESEKDSSVKSAVSREDALSLMFIKNTEVILHVYMHDAPYVSSPVAASHMPSNVSSNVSRNVGRAPVPGLPRANHEEPGLQPHDVRQDQGRLRIRVLLDLHGRMGEARIELVRWT